MQACFLASVAAARPGRVTWHRARNWGSPRQLRRRILPSPQSGIRRRSIGLAACLNLNPDYLPDHEISDCLQNNSDDQQRVPDGIGEQWAYETGIEHDHDDDDDRGHAHQQGHGEASLSGVDAYLALYLETLTNHIGQIVKNLSQVAAGLTLQHHRGDEEFYVDQGHTLGEIDERVAHRHTELLFFVELAKLSGDGFAHFVGDHFERGRESVSGPNRARQGVDRLGEKFLEFLKALIPPKRSVGVGQQESDQQGDPCDFNALAQGVSHNGGGEASESRKAQEVAGTHGDAALHQHFLEVGNAGRAPEQIVESGNLAELLIAQEGEFFFRGTLVGLALIGEALLDETSLSAPLIKQRHRGEHRERNHDEHQNRK